jgi:SAM-dependent methyltransferase
VTALGTLKQQVLRLAGMHLQQRIGRAWRAAYAHGGHEFPHRIALPAPCGPGLPERVVELLAARLSYRPGLRVLDIGHAYVMECHREMLASLPGPRDLTGVDIADPIFEASRWYTASHKASVADLPYDSASFDRVWCISALEHFGMDNSDYTREFVVDERLATRAMEEMMRVLRPGGALLLTLPYGRFENHGWFRNFDAAHLDALLAPHRGSAAIHPLYFRHARPDGWAAATPEALRDVSYGQERNAGAAACVIVTLVRHGGAPA